MEDLLEMKNAINHLGGESLKSYLGLALTHIKRLKERKDSPEREGAIDELIELYDQLMEYKGKQSFWDPKPGCTHVHIVVGESFAGGMAQALKGLGWAERHKLIVMEENYAIGPIGKLDSPEGRKARSDWFQNNITEALEAYDHFEEEYNDWLDQLKQIPEQAEVIIWTSRSVREQFGMRHAVHILRHNQNTIRVCDACAICEALYYRPDASIEYRHSGEIPPDKLREALRRMDDSGKLSAADIERLSKEWLDVSEQGGILRIWQNDAFQEVPADYYDSYLLEKLDKIKPPKSDNGFVKSARLIGEAIGYCEQDIGYSYFEYRLRELIYAGVLDIKGVPAAMRYYSIRRKRRQEQ